MPIVDTKPFMLPAVLHNIFAHRPQVTGSRGEPGLAWQIVRKCREEFQANGHDTLPIVMQGEAAESILKAAETHNPDIIALGSKGLTTTE